MDSDDIKMDIIKNFTLLELYNVCQLDVFWVVFVEKHIDDVRNIFFTKHYINKDSPKFLVTNLMILNLVNSVLDSIVTQNQIDLTLVV